MALAMGERVLAVTHGEIEGEIVSTPRGSNGFGYDPHFLVPHLQKTTAELNSDQKNAISHRGMALRAMIEHIRRLRDDAEHDG
jgi:XTP/dITP diphosphohydrolase